jgi:hypothetical protein
MPFNQKQFLRQAFGRMIWSKDMGPIHCLADTTTAHFDTLYTKCLSAKCLLTKRRGAQKLPLDAVAFDKGLHLRVRTCNREKLLHTLSTSN